MPFALFFAAVSITAWFGGFGPGFLVALFGAITTGYLMSTPDQLVVTAPLTLLVIATFISYVIEHRSRSQQALEATNVLLETERARLEAVLQQMPAGVIIAKVPSYELILANKKVDEILHHSFRPAEGLEQYTGYQSFHADGQPFKPEEYPVMRSAMTGEEVFSEEIEYLCGDGIRRIINTSSAPIRDQEGHITAALVVFYDLTEHKRLEEQFRQLQKMEAVGQLSGGVAHDFNNLLVVITGYSELMLERFLPEGHPSRGYIEEIAKAGEQAAVLTRQLLAFSRQQVLQPHVLNLNAVIANISQMLQRLIGEDIELRTNLDRELGSVKADPGQISQIIMNLAVNARDAMPRGGKLTIETLNISLDESYTNQHAEVQPGPYVLMAISDTGIGMDKETQARIFEPFFTTKEKERGTGLGLATVYGIVKQSGGHVWVYSEPGRGATFKIYLPRVGEVAEAGDGDEVESLEGSETILLVEDEEAVRKLTRMSLEIKGYTVLEAANAAEALAVSREYPGLIHLLLTDVVMPGRSGKELAEGLLQLRPEMKQVYISGYTDDAIVHHGVLEEGVAFLQKPFTPTALWRKVREVLDKLERK